MDRRPSAPMVSRARSTRRRPAGSRTTAPATAPTRQPAHASRAAAALPAGPAPTTSTSSGAAGSGFALVLEAIEDEPVGRGQGEREGKGAAADEADCHLVVVRGPAAGAVGGNGKAIGGRFGHDRLPAGAVGVDRPGRGPGLHVA